MSVAFNLSALLFCSLLPSLFASSSMASNEASMALFSANKASFKPILSGYMTRSKAAAFNTPLAGANFIAAQLSLNSPRFFAALRGEYVTEEDILDFLHSNTDSLPEGDEIIAIAAEYYEWRRLALFQALIQKISFEHHFSDLLALAYSTFADRDTSAYFEALIRSQAGLISVKLDSFWDFLMAHAAGHDKQRILLAVQILQEQLLDDCELKGRCSYHLFNHVLKDPLVSAAGINALLRSDLIDPNYCHVLRRSGILRVPLIYRLLSTEAEYPDQVYSCILSNPRVNVNCIIPGITLLGRDPEQSRDIVMTPLPIFYHAVILLNLKALLHICGNPKFSFKQVALYFPRFLLWLLSTLLKK